MLSLIVHPLDTSAQGQSALSSSPSHTVFEQLMMLGQMPGRQCIVRFHVLRHFVQNRANL